MRGSLIILVLIVVMVCIYLITTGFITNYRIQKREAYWKSEINSEIPNGTSKEKLIEYLNQRNLNSSWIPGQKVFNENVEQIPDAGIGFPCGSWNIIIYIFLGDDNRTKGNEIHSVGSCI